MEPMIKHLLRLEIIAASLSLASAQTWAEAHPEDAHAGDQVDLARDVLDDVLSRWAEKPWE